MQRLSEYGNKNPEPVISVRDVGVAYIRRRGMFRHKKFWALKNISFELYHGETLGVIGRNGVGKSTLLRLLAGIISADKGEIINHGVTASLLSLQVGFTAHLTGRENTIISGLMLGLDKKEILSRIDDISAYADIGEFFEYPVKYYSHGMRARLGFAIAVHAEPDVILLDEVLGVGDIDFKEKSTRSMREKINSNKTVVLVSHTTSLLRETCNRVIWIEDGLIKQLGDSDTVLMEYEAFQGRKRTGN